MSDSSFLPEDYLAQRAQRRTNLICLILFVVVMAAVFGAFLVTNQQWSVVKREQEAINARYQGAADSIQELTELEAQKTEMLHKAELAAALIERVPRSILLSELINRMPPRLSLLSFEMESEKMDRPRAVPRGESGDGRVRVREPRRARTMREAAEENDRVEAPQYRTEIILVGAAPTDQEVSRYLAELNAYPLFQGVRLEYSEEKILNERIMRQFRITMQLDPTADVRSIEPLIRQRSIMDPMGDDVLIAPPGRAVGSADKE